MIIYPKIFISNYNIEIYNPDRPESGNNDWEVFVKTINLRLKL